jgi:hypothetical protein
MEKMTLGIALRIARLGIPSSRSSILSASFYPRAYLLPCITNRNPAAPLFQLVDNKKFNFSFSFFKEICPRLFLKKEYNK